MQCIESVMDFLSGKQKKILDYLEGKMREAAEKMDYEEAASYRDYISAVKTLNETQRVTMTDGKDMDVIIPVGKGEKYIYSSLSGQRRQAQRKGDFRHAR